MFHAVRLLKGGQIGDDTAEVTVGPGPEPAGPAAQPWQHDLGHAAARGSGRGTAAPWDPLGAPEPVPVPAPAPAPAKPPLDLAESSALPGPVSWGAPAWQQRQRWIPWLRLWALVKMASLSYTTWWALGYLHENLGTQICAYGAMCLYAAVRSRWSGRRFRLFGPGMSIEPEFYEELGRWFYRAGVVLVLCGGAVFLAQGVLGTSDARQGPSPPPASASSASASGAGRRHQRLTGAAGSSYIRSQRKKWIGCRQQPFGRREPL